MPNLFINEVTASDMSLWQSSGIYQIIELTNKDSFNAEAKVRLEELDDAMGQLCISFF